MPTHFIRANAAELAEAIVEEQYARQPQVWKPYGSPGRVKSARDTRYHLDYLVEALEAGAPELFTAYISWVKVLFAGLHFPDTVLPTTLDCARQVLSARLPADERAPALELLDVSLRQVKETPETLPSFLGGAPFADLTQQYLAALLRGDRQTASRLILDAAERGVSVSDIYMNVFQASQREIGRLWQINQVSVAQEHYCTAATQLIMSQLYPRIFATEKKGRALVAACVGGELHEIGARMVTDLLELNGWDTHYLGANTPTASVLSMAAERGARVLALSTTMTFHLDQVRAVIAEARQSGLNARILVGGHPFNLAPDLWKKIGADGYAADARQAIAVAEGLIA